MPNELTIPPEVGTDPRARELARIWAAGGKQHVTLRIGLWRDPGSWGVMLADLVGHIANAYVQEESRDRAEVVERILDMFHREMSSPTDVPLGQIVPRPQ